MNPENDFLIFGATGLVGSLFLKRAMNDPFYRRIVALTRKELPPELRADNIIESVIDFSHPENYREMISAKTIICSIGTTINKAGSRENFKFVDYQIPLKIAHIALENGSNTFILISAVGADPSSRVFYNRVKGELERDLQRINFRCLHILHPSLITGDRKEKRRGEKFAKIMLSILNPLVPAKYRSINAETLAAKIDSLCRTEKEGVFIYEGRDLQN